jgi:hypothetical protein
MKTPLQNRRSDSPAESRDVISLKKRFADRQPGEALHAIEGHYYLSRA